MPASRPVARVLTMATVATVATAVAGVVALSSPAGGFASAAAPAATAAAAHTVRAAALPDHLQQAAGRPGASGLFDCQTTNPATCYAPKQIRAAYGFDKLGREGIEGQGTTIVIIDAFQSPTIRHDTADFDREFGLPPVQLNIIAPEGLKPFDINDGEQTFWGSEISLDVQWAHAIAPKATIDLVLAKTDSDADFEGVLRYVGQHGLGDVVSQSFSGPECDAPLARSAHRSYVAMVAHGTTPVAAAGDEGPAQFACVGDGFVRAAGNPATDPLVTGVGGTALFANGKTGSYQHEVVWDERQYDAAGGSGLSTLFAEPAFQSGVQHTGRRSVPDVAYNAAENEGVLIVDGSYGYGPDQFFIFGGTSSGTPQWSALIALSVQVAGHRLGDINPALYRLGTSSAYHSLFHDTTVGNNTVTLEAGSGALTTYRGPWAHPGWDNVTGFGSPKADALVPALAQAIAAAGQ